MKIKSVTESIPHRGPMLLVDEIMQLSRDEITCRKTFRPDEFFFQGHYPGNPLVPGVILCECAAQASAVLLANHHVDSNESDEKVPVLTRMNKVRFRKTVHPGHVIEINVKLDESVSGAFFLSAIIRLEGKTAASLELACTLAPKPAIHLQATRQTPPPPKLVSKPDLETAKRSPGS